MGGYPRPLSELPEIARLDSRKTPRLPGAAELANRLVTLPTHALLGEADLEDLPNRFISLFRPGI